MPRVARFGKFEFDLDRELLRRAGLSVRLPPQPSRLLALLVERAGEVVTREEIQKRLWPDGTHVDYEQGINHSIRQIRSVLGDDAATARFVQTIPKVGYRFFGVVELAGGNGHSTGDGLEHLEATRRDSVDQAETHRQPARSGVLSARVLLPIAGLVVLLGFLLGVRGVATREATDARIRLKRLTSHGRVRAAALSPDGRQIVEARFEDTGTAIYVQSLGTGSEIRLLDPVDTRIGAVGFYPDGERVFFLRQQTHGPGYSSLYRVPALGGPAEEMVFDIDSGAGFSPDGTRMAYIRLSPFKNQSTLVTANLDGTEERAVSVWKAPGSLGVQTPSWSPDGTRIAVVGRLPRADASFVPFVVDLESGERTALGERRWDLISGLAWTPGGGSIIMAAEPPGTADRAQIWSVSYPWGEPTRLTNDLDSYQSISMSADGRNTLTILRETVANLFSVAIRGDYPITPWTTGSLPQDRVLWVGSLAGGSIVYATREDDRYQLWNVNSPDGPRTPLLPDTFIGAAAFEVSADARSILYVAHDEHEIPQLFMLPASAGAPVQITAGKGVVFGGACSREGPFFIKRIGEDGLWRIDAPGETPLKISDWTPWSTPPYCSPDRRYIMFGTFVEKDGFFERLLVVLPMEGGEPAYKFPWSDGFLARWSPGGDAVTFVRHGSGGSDIFSLPLDSGEVERLTDVGGAFIFSWAWRDGGSSFVASRGRVNADVVLISTDQDPR